MIVQAAIAPLIAMVVLWRGLRPVGDAELQRFVNRFFVVVERTDRQFVSDRLRRSRALRSGAAAVGVLIAGLPSYMNLIDADRAGDFAVAPVGQAWLLGAAVAAVAAELLVVQRPVRNGEAQIAERRPEHYVSDRWKKTSIVLALVTLAVFVAGMMRGDDGLLEASTGAVGAVIALVAVTFGLGRIADRPRLGTEAHLQMLDDALRAYGAHHVAAAAVALGAASVSVAGAPFFNEVAPALNLLAAFIATGSLGLWYAIARDEPWPVGLPAEARR